MFKSKKVGFLVTLAFLLLCFSGAMYKIVAIENQLDYVKRQNMELRHQLIRLIEVTDAHTGNIMDRLDDLAEEVTSKQEETAVSLHWDLRSFKQNDEELTAVDKKTLQKKTRDSDEYFSKEP